MLKRNKANKFQVSFCTPLNSEIVHCEREIFSVCVCVCDVCQVKEKSCRETSKYNKMNNNGYLSGACGLRCNYCLKKTFSEYLNMTAGTYVDV